MPRILKTAVSAVAVAAAWASWIGWASLGQAAQPQPTVVPIERDFHVRAWRKEHGLPDDRVLCVLAARDGCIWVGTRKGVARFDGNRFTTWSRSTHDVFTSEECHALATDREGVIWVGTSDRLIQLGAAPLGFELRTILYGSPARSPAHQNRILTLCACNAGELLMGTEVGIMSHRADGSWRRVQDDQGFLRTSSDGTALAATPDGAVWVGTGGAGLFRRQQPDAPWIRELTEPEYADTQYVHALAVTRDGVVHGIVSDWPGAWTGPLLRRDATGWKPVLDFGLATRICVPFLTPDSAGGLWFPTTNRVLGHWLNDTLTQYALPAAVIGRSLLCMAEDAEGNLWAGTVQDGLVCLLPRRIRTLTAEDGLPDPKTRALLEASDGTLWAGTDGGVVQLSQNEPRVLNRSSGLASDMVRAIAEDAQGGIWIGTVLGLSLWDGQSLEPVVYPGADYRTKIRALLRGSGLAPVVGAHESVSAGLAPRVPDLNRPQPPNRVSPGSALRMRRPIGGGGVMWVGTAQGLYRLGSDRTNAWLVADGLPHENVCAVHEDRQGQVWIGTDGGGLVRFTGAGFERFDASNRLSSLRVYALHDDAEGALWIGTDRGLNVLRGERISALTTAHGLPDNLVNGIVEDRHGWLWIGHDRGVYRVKRQELIEVADGLRSEARCISYAEEDGLLNPETNGQNSYPPAIRLRDGRVAFATMGGVALFDPDAPPDLTNGPCAHIEELRVGERVLFTARSGGTGSDPSVNPKHRLTVGPMDRGILNVDFAVAAFRAPGRVRCRYRLLGLSPNWTDSGALRQATFASLRPGDYTFEVSAANHHGYQSAQPARLSFRIAPHWYERATVQFCGAILLFAAVGTAVRWRLREQRRLSQLEHQAALARERARLAKDLHDGLGASLTEITLLSGVGDSQRLSAEAIAARFDRLSRRTHEALHSLRDLIWTTNPRADSVQVLLSHVCESAERALETAGLRCRLDFPAELPQLTLGPEFRKQVLLAANEAVNNAIRHAHATRVSLRFAIENANLTLEIEDDGVGFDPAEVARRAPGSDRALGLASMRERLASLGGRCDARSQPGRGTTVTFRVPLPPLRH